MSKDYSYEMIAHPSLYNMVERKLKVYFSEPDNGINEETGILLLIAGFGGNASSNVYKKMRRMFTDKYNLVTLQCDYFGWQFMQEANNISLNIDKDILQKYFTKDEIEYIYIDNNIFSRLMEVSSKNKVNIQCKEILKENLDNYNDMGLLQAIDNISAVINVMEIIEDNGYKFNKDKKILYGHSHGGYLSYLCNAFAPDMFSLLIDNSAWIFPAYLKSNRYLNNLYGDSMLTIEFEYLAKSIAYDEEILNLRQLYKKFDNNCNIICYHGSSDNLISHKDKVKLKAVINKFNYNYIDEKSIDNIIFKSTNHGLGADFLELFDYTMKNHNFKIKDRFKINRKEVIYSTNEYQYIINYDEKMPVLYINKK